MENSIISKCCGVGEQMSARGKERIVQRDIITGLFVLPLGISFLSRRAEDDPVRKIEVSTVLLDNGHLEDPLGILEPETGYETLIFLGGCCFFSVYTEKYKTYEEAKAGHQKHFGAFER